MSGAEVLAVVGIVSNILQLADFCAKVTDRTLEFCGRTANLPGSFSDLRVVLAVVRLNLGKLQTRIKSTNTDQETMQTLKDLVRLIERDAKMVHHYLEKKLPAPGASWAKVTLKAASSVFGETKIKTSIDSILKNVELLGQSVTASLPSAAEIAEAIEKSQTKSLDRSLSVIMERMKDTAVSKTAINKTTFNNQKHEHRTNTTGHAINVKGHTQINNTYVTIQMSYDDLGAQLDQAKGTLTVPGTNLPFHPLIKSVSNPNLPGAVSPRRHSEADARSSVSVGRIIDVEDIDEKSEHPYSRSTTPRPDPTRRATTGRPVSPRSRTPQPPIPMSPHFLTSPTNPSPRFLPPPSQIGINDDESEFWDSQTVAPSVVPSNIGSRFGLEQEPMAPIRTQLANHQRSSSQSTYMPSPITPFPPEALHSSVFEMSAAQSVVSGPASSVGTASDAWSDFSSPTLLGSQATSYSDGASAVSMDSATTAVEDLDAIIRVNAFIRDGARAVTTNPSEAKRAYMCALNTCKPIVANSPSFAVRKYRALTLAAVGLSLCTMDRERYLKKAREYNAQATTAANRTNESSVVHRVRLDEADLQMKEARMLEKKGAGGEATMKQFTAFGTYEGIAMDLAKIVNAQGGAVTDYNTHALARLGQGKMAVILNRNPGTFRTSQGEVQAPHTYWQQAMESCNRGRGVYGARQEDLSLLRDTEAQVQRVLGSAGN